MRWEWDASSAARGISRRCKSFGNNCKLHSFAIALKVRRDKLYKARNRVMAGCLTPGIG